MGKMAVIVISDEIITEWELKREEKNKRVILLHSNSNIETKSLFKKIPEKQVRNLKDGDYYRIGKFGILEIIWPREKDLILSKRIGNHTVKIFKLWLLNGEYFEDGELSSYLTLAEKALAVMDDRLLLPDKDKILKFVEKLFSGWISCRGGTDGMPVTLNTPCYDFFHADIDGIDMAIIQPISERFGLENFDGYMLFPSAGSHIPDDALSPIYQKYPVKDFCTEKFTVQRLIDWVYDITRVKYGLDIKGA